MLDTFEQLHSIYWRLLWELRRTQLENNAVRSTLFWNLWGDKSDSIPNAVLYLLEIVHVPLIIFMEEQPNYSSLLVEEKPRRGGSYIRSLARLRRSARSVHRRCSDAVHAAAAPDSWSRHVRRVTANWPPFLSGRGTVSLSFVVDSCQFCSFCRAAYTEYSWSSDVAGENMSHRRRSVC